MLHDSKTRLLGEEDHIRTWNAGGGHLKSVGLTLASGVLIFLERWKSIAHLLLITAYVQANTECYYTAAALQYHAWVGPGHTNTSEAALRHVALHLNGMELHINQAAQRGASIVVLPEAALWGAGLQFGRTGVRYYGEEIPSNGTIPCDSGLAQNRPSVRLSCMAKHKKVTIVANVLDVVPRSSNPNPNPNSNPNPNPNPDDFWNFNTNVVFNPDGRIVAIYHKQHLYMEAPTMDQGNVTSPPVFTVPLKSRPANATCGSVRMGTLICADIYFETPWNAATLRSKNVRHLAYPTAWSSDPPLYMAAMLQHGFAHAKDVVLIAANSGKHYKNGAGIFDANTVLAQIHSDNHDLTTLIVADVDVAEPVSSCH